MAVHGQDFKEIYLFLLFPKHLYLYYNKYDYMIFEIKKNLKFDFRWILE